ncbi:MAG: transcription termination/antitermination NusG family protein [Gemmatales bacterium]|nr:hypothetical protein [Gemmatales bacterium]MCS7159727.1 hypothetical protein [Gemmatales bacterium]MDW8174925.1 transcription termination/antitermination NusG family protein [Gemmatales bacterium]MDW8221875.1 transcription termination/antitermination NusG family protein [Gemmatales bacterium]
MPILAKEPACYPADLFERIVPGSEERWWVFYTRPRCEKAIARHLRAYHFSYFLPVYKKCSRIRGRTVAAWHVLFPSYIFVYGSSNARLAALKTNSIIRELDVPDQGELHEDLSQINALQQSELPFYPEPSLKPGVPIRVSAGPLLGLTGKVVSWRSPLRLMVEVRMLQRAVCLELEPWMVSLS